MAAAPGDADRLFTLGLAQAESNLDDAIETFRKVVAIAARPDYADAHYSLGAVLKAKGDLNAAAAALERAIALTPDSSGAHYVLSQVLRLKGDARGAQTHLAESERLRQQREREHEASVLTYLGIQQFGAGEPAKAIDFFKQAIAAFDAYAPAHYQMGRALQQLGRTAEARAAFARAHQLHAALVPPPDLP